MARGTRGPAEGIHIHPVISIRPEITECPDSSKPENTQQTTDLVGLERVLTFEQK